jgi:hypothetical protein
VPGRLPSLGSAGPLFIWPGISNPTSDLIQTTLNDDHVTIEYKLEPDGKTWPQTVSSQKLGKVVSTTAGAG